MGWPERLDPEDSFNPADLGLRQCRRASGLRDVPTAPGGSAPLIMLAHPQRRANPVTDPAYAARYLV